MLAAIDSLIQQRNFAEACSESVRQLTNAFSFQLYEYAAKLSIGLREQQDWESAFNYLTELENMWPAEEKPLAFNMELGHVYRYHKQFECALRAYQQVISKSPQHPWGIFWTAKVLYELREFELARFTLKPLTNTDGLAGNLIGEIGLLDIDLAIASDNLSTLSNKYRDLGARLTTLPAYIGERMIQSLYSIPSSIRIFECLITFYLRIENNPHSQFKLAKLFYQIDSSLLAMTVLLKAESDFGLSESQLNLLIECVLTSLPCERTDTWLQAKQLLDKKYLQNEAKHGYWQYWTDYWQNASVQSIKHGANTGVKLPETLERFHFIYWAIRNNTPSIPRKSGAVRNLVTYSTSKIGVEWQGNATKVNTCGATVKVHQYNHISARRFIAEHFNETVNRAWRLARHQGDKKRLFAVCYLLKHGGVFLPEHAIKDGRCADKLSNTPYGVAFVKSNLGVSTDFVAATPNHPLMLAILNAMVLSLTNRSRLPDLYTTGGIAWVKVINQYYSEMMKRARKPDVGVLCAHEMFGFC